MKVLFDNNVPAALRKHLPRHEVHTARRLGWHEIENGELLATAERVAFDVMVTGDKNIAYQQNLYGRTIALVALPTIDWTVLKRAPATLAAIATAVDRAVPGSFERLERLPPRHSVILDS